MEICIQWIVHYIERRRERERANIHRPFEAHQSNTRNETESIHCNNVIWFNENWDHLVVENNRELYSSLFEHASVQCHLKEEISFFIIYLRIASARDRSNLKRTFHSSKQNRLLSRNEVARNDSKMLGECTLHTMGSVKTYVKMPILVFGVLHCCIFDLLIIILVHSFIITRIFVHHIESN